MRVIGLVRGAAGWAGMEVSSKGGLGITEGSRAGEVGMIGSWEGESSVLGEEDTGEE